MSEEEDAHDFLNVCCIQNPCGRGHDCSCREQLADLLRSARRSALLEAAEVADSHVAGYDADGNEGDVYVALQIATAIRTLAEVEDDER
jgi:hypothetical protein